MKSIEDVKVDLVNSKWLSFNEVDLQEDEYFNELTKVLKKDEVVYSVIMGNILIDEKALIKKAKKLVKLQMKQAKSGEPLSPKMNDMMDKLSDDIADPKEPGKAIMVMTDSRIIVIYQDLNKKYKIRVAKHSVDDITELDAKEEANDKGLFSIAITFGKKSVKLVTDNVNDIKHFEFTLDQLIEIEAKKEIAKDVEKMNKR